MLPAAGAAHRQSADPRHAGRDRRRGERAGHTRTERAPVALGKDRVGHRTDRQAPLFAAHRRAGQRRRGARARFRRPARSGARAYQRVVLPTLLATAEDFAKAKSAAAISCSPTPSAPSCTRASASPATTAWARAGIRRCCSAWCCGASAPRGCSGSMPAASTTRWAWRFIRPAVRRKACATACCPSAWGRASPRAMR